MSAISRPGEEAGLVAAAPQRSDHSTLAWLGIFLWPQNNGKLVPGKPQRMQRLLCTEHCIPWHCCPCQRPIAPHCPKGECRR